MDIQENQTKPEDKTSKPWEVKERLSQFATENQTGNTLRRGTEPKSDSTCQYLPALEISGLETKKDRKGFEQQYKEYQERLQYIEISRQVAENQEQALKRNISKSQKEIDSSSFMDGLLGNKDRLETQVKHRKEELAELERGRRSAQKVMDGASPDIARAEELLQKEQQERQRGERERKPIRPQKKRKSKCKRSCNRPMVSPISRERHWK